MTEFASEYEESVMRGMKALHDKLFPPAAMQSFADSATADIEAGKNICGLHPDRVTMQRFWPSGKWICDQCAQHLWSHGGFPAGTTVFDMSDRPKDWKP